MSVGRYLLRSDSRVSTASVICLFVPLYFRQLSQELSVKIKMVLGKLMVFLYIINIYHIFQSYDVKC